MPVTTTNHALVLHPGHGPSRDRDHDPRTLGQRPIGDAQSHRHMGCALVPGKADGRDRNRCMQACRDCTTHVPHQSSAPYQPVQYHQNLAYCSPPFHFFQTILYSYRSFCLSSNDTTIWATNGLALAVQPGRDHT